VIESSHVARDFLSLREIRVTQEGGGTAERFRCPSDFYILTILASIDKYFNKHNLRLGSPYKHLATTEIDDIDMQQL